MRGSKTFLKSLVCLAWIASIGAAFTSTACWSAARGQGPTGATKDAAKQPQIVELSPQAKRNSKANEPELIDIGKYRWYAVDNYTGPVTWELQGESFLSFRETTKPTTLCGIVQDHAEPDFFDVPVGSVILYGKAKGNVVLSAFGVVDGKAKRLVTKSFVVDGGAPQPPPKPVDPVEPDDKKPKPKPKPVVSSFRVILAYESGQTMTTAQTNVLYGGEVENWLNANCTGGKTGWRRRDKDATGDADPTMAELWKAVKEKLTTVPAIAVEVNGEVEIIPLEATPAATVAKLKTYREGK